MSELKADDYRGKPLNSRQGHTFKAWNRRGYTGIVMLPFLTGKPWDEVALGFVHALRPSHVRVVRDGEGIQLDAQTWRVTVYLKRDLKTVERIEQEVEVGLPKECVHGAALDAAFQYGLDSKQVKWHALPGTTVYDGINRRVYKAMDNGKTVPWPKPRKKK